MGIQTSYKSGTKTPVAVVRAQPKDKKVEKAVKYVTNFSETFAGRAEAQTQFVDAINGCRTGCSSVEEMLLAVTDLLSGHRELLCSLTGFLPPGHTIGIQNNDPTQVIVRIPGQRSTLSRDQLNQYVESIRNDAASAGETRRIPPPETSGLDELITQFDKLST